MGTRGLWGLRKDGIDKLTYNHWDSYPTALGETIKSFILNHSPAELNEVFDKIILIKSNSRPTKKQIKEGSKLMKVLLFCSQSLDYITI